MTEKEGKKNTIWLSLPEVNLATTMMTMSHHVAPGTVPTPRTNYSQATYLGVLGLRWRGRHLGRVTLVALRECFVLRDARSNSAR